MQYVLTIQERGYSWAGRSPVSSVHPTRSAAEGALLDYVKRNWDAETGTEMPDDPNEMIACYFSEVLEGYDISESEVEHRTA